MAALDEELGDALDVLFGEHGAPPGQSREFAKREYLRAGVVAVLSALVPASPEMAEGANRACGPLLIRGDTNREAFMIAAFDAMIAVALNPELVERKSPTPIVAPIRV